MSKRKASKIYLSYVIHCFSAIESNSAAIKESVKTLQSFQSFMSLLVQKNDALLQSERLMLKIIRLKFELDAAMRSLEEFADVLLEIVDRSAIGYPSRFLFTPEYLSR